MKKANEDDQEQMAFQSLFVFIVSDSRPRTPKIAKIIPPVLTQLPP